MADLSLTTHLPRTAEPRPGLFAMIAVWRQRRALARMDARLLDDIGVSRAQALAEANRPIWDVPANWRS